VGERHLWWVLHEQVNMVFLSVELGQGRVEVRADLRQELFAPVEHLRVEHANPIVGDERQADVQVAGDAAIALDVGVRFTPGCRRPTLRCVP